MIVKSIQVGQIGTNCYLFGEEETKVCAVVDPGDEAHRIVNMIRESGMELRAIFVTHGHFDHCLAVSDLLEVYPDVPVYIHEAELNATRIPNNYMQMMPCKNLHTVQEGDRISVGTMEVAILNTPGHSPGSLILQVGSAMFVGDTLFQGSCGRTDFYNGSYEEMLISLKRLYDLPGDFTVYPGHEAFTTLAREREHNNYMREAVNRVR